PLGWAKPTVSPHAPTMLPSPRKEETRMPAAVIRLQLLLLLAGLSACAPPVQPDNKVPPFARVPYEPVSRASIVAVALREWRLFGSPVDDDPPGSRPPPLPADKPEREQGLWQRVGEYWWTGMNPGSPEAAWTGEHDQRGAVFPASVDGDYA